MKGYTVILAILWFVNSLVRVFSLLHPPGLVPALLYVVDIALFTLCLAAAMDFSFSTRLLRGRFGRDELRLLSRATLAAGVATTGLIAFGSRLNVPGYGPGPDPLSLLLILLPYVLMAIPVIVHEHESGRAEARASS